MAKLTGTSSSLGKKDSAEWIELRKDEINSILDIGAGSGTYFRLLSHIKNFNWNAVEVWKPYIDKHNLCSMYHSVYNTNIKEFEWNKDYDLTIAGDILEHLSKEDAVSVVDKILTHSKFLLVSIPIVHYPQEEINNNPYELHVKDDWSHIEMEQTFGTYIKKYLECDEIGIYWLEK
jgi:predicted TPR repeat methyltransferase